MDALYYYIKSKKRKSYKAMHCFLLMNLFEERERERATLIECIL
jgi:hypothetical protein